MFCPDFRKNQQHIRLSRKLTTTASDPDIQAVYTAKVPAFKLSQAELRKLVEEIIG